VRRMNLLEGRVDARVGRVKANIERRREDEDGRRMSETPMLRGEKSMGGSAMACGKEVRGFACGRCQRVKVVSRVSRDFWNEVITYLTGGLLYGSEVKRPEWVGRERKREYVPRPNAMPAWRRAVVQEKLLLGWSYKRIAAEMGITCGTVDTHARKIYAEHRVHGRWELAKQLRAGIERPATKRSEIKRRLEAGEDYGRIAREMGITRKYVSAEVSYLRKGRARSARRARARVGVVAERRISGGGAGETANGRRGASVR